MRGRTFLGWMRPFSRVVSQAGGIMCATASTASITPPSHPWTSPWHVCFVWTFTAKILPRLDSRIFPMSIYRIAILCKFSFSRGVQMSVFSSFFLFFFLFCVLCAYAYISVLLWLDVCVDEFFCVHTSCCVCMKCVRLSFSLFLSLLCLYLSRPHAGLIVIYAHLRKIFRAGVCLGAFCA